VFTEALSPADPLHVRRDGVRARICRSRDGIVIEIVVDERRWNALGVKAGAKLLLETDAGATIAARVTTDGRIALRRDVAAKHVRIYRAGDRDLARAKRHRRLAAPATGKE
jgi:hypothetical protein